MGGGEERFHQEQAPSEIRGEIVEHGVVLRKDRLAEVDFLARRVLAARSGLPDDVAVEARRSGERACREACRVHHREGRVRRVVVRELHARVAQRNQVGSIGTDEVGTQAVPDEDEDVALRISGAALVRGRAGNEHESRKCDPSVHECLRALCCTMPFDPQASFGKALFFGEILEDQIFPYPKMEPEEKETVRSVVEAVSKYLATVDGAKLDRLGEMPKDLLQNMRELGLFGLIVPQEYGGIGLGNTGYARVMEEVAGQDGSIAVTVGAHSSIGFKGLLLFGTREQKERWLPRLATGEIIAAFCLTEPSSGSDAFSIRTRAVKSADGSHYVLNGEKIWITNGGIADFFTVFAKTTPDTPEQKGKITAFAVTRDMGGVSHGPHEDKMGIRA